MKSKASNEGPFRITCVGNTGLATTKTVKKWSEARRLFEGFKEMPHIRYAVVFENSEDPAFQTIRDECLFAK